MANTIDEITWNPRRGSTGDDKYDIPGSTLLSGTIDYPTNAPQGIVAGDISGFSSTPTLAQINATSGVNQIIGYVNRRIQTYNTLFGTSMTTLSYVTSGATPILATTIRAIQDKIDVLRAQEGWSAYNWDFLAPRPTAGNTILGMHFADCRRALSVGNLTLTLTCPTQCVTALYTRTDNPYGTFSSDNILINNQSSEGQLGKINAAGNILRKRGLFSFQFPNITGMSVVGFSMTVGAFTTDPNPPTVDDTSLESFTAELWRSSTDDHLYSSTSVASNFNTLIATSASQSGASGTTFNLDAVDNNGIALGGFISYICCTTAERNGTGLSPLLVHWSDYGIGPKLTLNLNACL